MNQMGWQIIRRSVSLKMTIIIFGSVPLTACQDLIRKSYSSEISRAGTDYEITSSLMVPPTGRTTVNYFSVVYPVLICSILKISLMKTCTFRWCLLSSESLTGLLLPVMMRKLFCIKDFLKHPFCCLLMIEI